MAAYSSSAYFSRATFTIVAASTDIPVDNVTIVAVGTTTPGYLTYKTEAFKGSDSTTVPASDGPYVSTKATGSVVLYNAYSSLSQRLVAGTRLANDSGLIYRLAGSVVIPGDTTVNGVTLPGKTSAAIVAEAAGASYNISGSDALSDFKIVAYKGTPRYNGFYGRLTSDVSGGFAGQKKIVSQTVLSSTAAALQAAITARLLAEAKAAVPTGYIMYDTGYTVSFSAPAVGGMATGTASVALSGTLDGILFKTKDLVGKLDKEQKRSAFGDFSYTTPGLESLSFSISNPKDFSPAKGNTLIARLNGDIRLVGIVPVQELKGKLAGKLLAETQSVLQSYSRVIDMSGSSGELFPSWTASVPTDFGRISVILKD
jgi:hypothetical protein